MRDREGKKERRGERLTEFIGVGRERGGERERERRTALATLATNPRRPRRGINWVEL